MDLWDVVRLMVRRWYVAAPMLLLTVVAVAGTAVAVSPNHTAEAQVMVLPPSSQRDTEPGEDRVVNPWDPISLTGAIVTMLRNYNLVEQLEEEGHRATWEADTDLQFQSVIVITVTSPTEHEATTAVDRLLQEVQAEVTEQQAPYDIPDTEKITAVVLGAGENVEVVRGNQIRAMVVVLAAFLILTIGVTIGYDALARRRRTRRSGPADQAAPAAPATAPSSPAPQYTGTNGRQLAEQPPPVAPAHTGSPYASGNGARGAEPASGGTVYTAGGSRTESASAEAAPAGGHAAEASMQAPIQVSYRPPPKWPVVASGPGHDNRGGSPPEADDSTIVLPLSGTSRLRKRQSGDADAGDAGPPEAGER